MLCPLLIIGYDRGRPCVVDVAAGVVAKCVVVHLGVGGTRCYVDSPCPGIVNLVMVDVGIVGGAIVNEYRRAARIGKVIVEYLVVVGVARTARTAYMDAFPACSNTCSFKVAVMDLAVATAASLRRVPCAPLTRVCRSSLDHRR